MKLYIAALTVLVVLGIANYFGQTYSLPFLIQGYDVYLHVMGGVGLALMFLGVHRSFLGAEHETLQTLALIACGVFAAGLIWECFEAYYNIAGAPVGSLAYYADTAKDLFDDILGAILGLYIVRKSCASSRVLSE